MSCDGISVSMREFLFHFISIFFFFIFQCPHQSHPLIPSKKHGFVEMCIVASIFTSEVNSGSRGQFASMQITHPCLPFGRCIALSLFLYLPVFRRVQLSAFVYLHNYCWHRCRPHPTPADSLLCSLSFWRLFILNFVFANFLFSTLFLQKSLFSTLSLQTFYSQLCLCF